MSGQPYILHAWMLSYFSGKVRAYLRCKNIPFREEPINIDTLLRRIPAKTGVTAMPVLETPEGAWLQDSTIIIEYLESRYPHRPMIPDSPRQRIAAMLLEVWSDEWWIPPAMHYRWAYPENYDLFQKEAGKALWPWGLRFIGSALAAHAASTLKSYLPRVGAVPGQFFAMEKWTNRMLDALELHLSEFPYLLGHAPCIADFALIGPLYAHLGRDPAPLRDLIRPRPNVAGWIERVHEGHNAAAERLPEDTVPGTLDPFFESIFSELFAMGQQIAAAVEAIRTARDTREKSLPRSLGPRRVTLGNEPFERDALPYTLWMLQRVQQAYRDLSAEGLDSVNTWISRFEHGHRLAEFLGPALRRDGLQAALV
jgi:glutathione S-transferase